MTTYTDIRLNELEEALPSPQEEVEAQVEEEKVPRRGILIALDGDAGTTDLASGLHARLPDLEWVDLPAYETPTGRLLSNKPPKFFYSRDAKDERLARACVRAANALEVRIHIEHMMSQGVDVLVTGYTWDVAREMGFPNWQEALDHVERLFGPMLIPDLQILVHASPERPNAAAWQQHPRIVMDIIKDGVDVLDELVRAVEHVENTHYHELRRYQDEV